MNRAKRLWPFLLALAFAGCGAGDAKQVQRQADTAAAVVGGVSVSPADGETGVSVRVTVRATFPAAVDASAMAFTLATGAGPVVGTSSYDAASLSASFVTTTALAYGTVHTATITGVKDGGGSDLPAVSWTFTTALHYSGYVSNIPPPNGDSIGGIVSITNAWTPDGTRTDQGVKFAWDVLQVGSSWQYTYTMYGNDKAMNKRLQYIDIETPLGFAAGELQSWRLLVQSSSGPDYLWDATSSPTTQAHSTAADIVHGYDTTNPSSTIGLHGIEWVVPMLGVAPRGRMAVLTFTTQRSPVWGDFLVMSGDTASGHILYPYATNSMRGLDPDALHTAITSGNNGGWALVPGRDLVPPTVASVTPAAGATNAGIDAPISVTFSEAVQEATLAGALTLDGTACASTSCPVTYEAATRTATFTHATFALGSAHSVSVSAQVLDPSGNALVPFSWSFTATATIDTTPPTVTLTSPALDATGVASNAPIVVQFSEPVQEATLAGALTLDGAACASTSCPVTYEAATRTATFGHPALSYNALHTVSVGAQVLDLADPANHLVPATWSFTTGAPPDTTPPTVSSVTPIEGSVGVSLAAAITATFDEPIDPASLHFTLNGVAPTGVSYDAGTHTATFGHAALAYSTTYTATISDVADLSGNHLAQAKTWTFTATPSGDPNGDGTLTEDDVQLALEIAAGNATPTDPQRISGDVAPLVGGVSHPDGIVDVGDVVVLLNRLARM